MSWQQHCRAAQQAPQAGEGSQGKCVSGLQAGNTILTNEHTLSHLVAVSVMDKLPYLQSCNLRGQLALPISPPCFKLLLQLNQLLLYCIVLCLCNACDCFR